MFMKLKRGKAFKTLTVFNSKYKSYNPRLTLWTSNLLFKFQAKVSHTNVVVLHLRRSYSDRCDVQKILKKISVFVLRTKYQKNYEYIQTFFPSIEKQCVTQSSFFY